jgi:hypothetical protein
MALARQFAPPHRPARPSRRSNRSTSTTSPAFRPRATPPPPSSAPPPPDSDPAFLAKLLAISFTGAAAVKYGSLLLEAPFHPEPGLAAAFVILPTLAYWAVLASEAGRTVNKGD